MDIYISIAINVNKKVQKIVIYFECGHEMQYYYHLAKW